MEHIKDVIFGACMLSLGVGICNVLRPGKMFEKQIRFLISLLFVFCLTMPLLRIDYESIAAELTQAAELPETDTLNSAMETALLEETAVCTEAAVRSLLEQNGIICTHAEAVVHIGESDSIYISEVSVTCDDFQRASEILRSQLGEEVELHVSEVVS